MDKTKQKQEMKLNNFISMLVVVGLLVVIVASFISFNLTKNMLHTQRIVAKKMVAKKTLDTNVDSAKQLVENYNSSESRHKFLMDALPITPDFTGFANAMEVIAGTSGVTLTTITTGASLGGLASSAANGTVVMPITMNLTTTNANLARFLIALESSARPVHILGMSLSGTNANLTVSITANTYYQIPSSFQVKKEVVK